LRNGLAIDLCDEEVHDDKLAFSTVCGFDGVALGVKLDRAFAYDHSLTLAES